MTLPLVRKLEHFIKLSPEDKRRLEAATSARVRELGAGEDIIQEGEKPTQLNLLLQGFACRYKVLEDGRRQILAFFLPGDLCDLRMFILKEMDHSIGCLSRVSFAQISPEALDELTHSSQTMRKALWWNSLVEESIAREWIVNVGRRNAAERMAHVFCEVFLRMQAVGLAKRDTCDFPVTQAELGDALGLTDVHTNRTLQELRAQKLVALTGRKLTIPDLAALEVVGLFNRNYLHLERVVS